MKRAREFDEILNECIERVLKGESVEACLAAYPEHAAELQPLLRTASETRKAAAIMPRPEFRQQAAYEFQSAIRELKPAKRGSLQWQVRLVTALSLVVIILMAGTGTVAAAGSSLPDQPLYPVKLATEDMRLALTSSALDKAQLYTEFADKRVNEIIKMADKGKAAQVERVTERMSSQLVAMANLALPAREADVAADETTTAIMAVPSAESAVASAAAPVKAAAPGQTPTVNAPVTGQGTPPAAVVKPPQTATPPVTTAKTATLPTPNTSAKAPVPAPVSPDYKAQPSTPASFSSANLTSRQEIKPTQTLRAATATALKSAEVEKLEKVNKEKIQANLKNTVSQQAEKNAQQLEDVKKRVPDNIKQALEKAIDAAGKGYDEALKNMDPKK